MPHLKGQRLLKKITRHTKTKRETIDNKQRGGVEMNLYALRDFFNMILDMNLNVLLGYVLAIYLFLCWLFVKLLDCIPSLPHSYSVSAN